MKARNCKIIAVYFGVRRTYPHNYLETIKILQDSMQNEIELDPGVDNLDIIFINHNFQSIIICKLKIHNCINIRFLLYI